MSTLLFIVATVGFAIWALRAATREDFRRVSGAGLSALEEIITPHAAEHRRIDEHTAMLAEDDEGGADDDHRPPGLVPR